MFEKLFRQIFAAGLVGLVSLALGLPSSQDAQPLPSNAPDGAIEYFESREGDSLTIFSDRIELAVANDPDGVTIIPMSETRTMKIYGNRMYINTAQGQLKLDIDGFGGHTTLKRLRELITELQAGDNSNA